MKNFIRLLSVILICSGFSMTWGFYGHRLINRTAVYCLPGDMINLFKENIDYISEHAVDPDKRRYATPFEAVRHYIDIDHWGENPFEIVPRNYVDAVTKFGDFYVVNGADTTYLSFDTSEESKEFQNTRAFVKNNWMSQRYEEEQIYNCDSLAKYFDLKEEECLDFRFTDVFSTYGILPYELGVQQYRLTEAFQNRDVNRIMRIATDMGHYIADAHVPLHTTENYNGQFTGQKGIHGFWESRIPELYSDNYDFFIGKAVQVDKPLSFFWGLVHSSHSQVDSVLLIEKRLSNTYPKDMQFTVTTRGRTNMKTYSAKYAKEYSDAMDNMVENRMQTAIISVGSIWYSAWIKAGRPELKGLMDQNISQKYLDKLERTELELMDKKVKSREHEH